MIALLAKVFIKDRQNYSDGTVRKKYGTLTGITGIVLNVFLFIGKFIAGSISGAISIMADAFNNLSDAGSSVISLAGFMMADKKPDPDHPFGHGRMECTRLRTGKMYDLASRRGFGRREPDRAA